MGYLFGANAESIQQYIFATNLLKEVVGASEAVKLFCSEKELAERLDSLGIQLDDQAEINQAAAGGIKIFFKDKESARKFCRDFIRDTRKHFPGLSFSVAGVEGEAVTGELLGELSKKLQSAKVRPLPRIPVPMMVQTAPRTGEPAAGIKENEFLDAPTLAKRELFQQSKEMEKAFESQLPFPQEIDKIASERGWIAIIHADGNGLGQVIREIGQEARSLKEFSVNLDNATFAASRQAFEKSFLREENQKEVKFRPVIVGGDDITVICDADRALDFAEQLCCEFEEQTLERTGKKLTLCAGIAFVKAHYPFWMGYQLAEELCGAAKKVSKQSEHREGGSPDGLPASSLCFHFVGSSYHRGWDDILVNELCSKDGISYFYGPYGVHADGKLPRVDSLRSLVKALDGERSPKSKLRELLTRWNTDSSAETPLFMQRFAEIASGEQRQWMKDVASLCPGFDFNNPAPDKKTPIYDLVMLTTHTRWGRTTSSDKEVQPC
ncbi:hypothetical protein LGV61_05350 [Desulfurispirillum indicum]|uniref:Cas10/Cmr2 second palm domain-containing protein n=1 Tax=Desulfurispirillum indicum TaxID=936456 RepID=UPI001CFC2EAF|nr:hypothetical protein [Desulfurispirillum indicum]UCZ57701.1 hypothetical protein LGV61_05350 [Desulfurispirillum indicum]